ncbi:hypothetical protein, partial [Bathymodiolus platifrons methanotrophic gill symbiont]|uniref:hypothetical protein n=1 Tax=Bathymodiolus platifrons methanotrophic gill symbiont TaxID=113268 RepID=UPI000B40DD01
CDDDFVSILINKSDKEISDPVFTTPENNKRRTAKKEENEGQDFSVHMVIKLPNEDIDTALVLIEYCQGLTISMIKEVLKKILSDAKEISPEYFKQLHPDGSRDDDGNQKKYNVTFTCDFSGHPSNEFIDDLNNGKVQFIELITEEDRCTPFDEEAYFQKKHKTVVLTTKDKKIPNIYSKIKNLISKKTDYQKAKVKFMTKDNMNKTLEIFTDEGTMAYLKKVKLDDFGIDLKSSYEKINKPILGKMKELLLSETS